MKSPRRHRKATHPSSHHLSLSPRAKHNIHEAIRRSLAPATLRSYRSVVRQFMIFCDQEHIPTSARTPASEPLLCAFVANGLGQVSGSTMRNRLAALKAWHSANNWTWYGSDRLKRILKGIDNTNPRIPLPKRPPVSIHSLEILARRLDPNDATDIAILACACAAFWGQCRLGELLPTSSRTSTLELLPRRRSIRHSPGNKYTWILNIPATKTSQKGQDIPLVRQKGPTDPLLTLHNHLQRNKAPLHLPLFTVMSRKEGPRILTKKMFLDRCNDIWTNAKLPALTGHCFRIGGTTHLLLAGVPPDVVKTMGRWSSDAFLRYWRSTELIAPIYMKDLVGRKRNPILPNTRRQRWG